MTKKHCKILLSSTGSVDLEEGEDVGGGGSMGSNELHNKPEPSSFLLLNNLGCN